ncbi:MAG: hypothetical protein WCO09_01080 [bacterium]
MKPYLYFEGLIELAKKLKGTEVIHVGIRPYGFHAGNAMTFVVYPYLLCKYLEKEGKKARFNFVVSINDWEQDFLDGPDTREYPFNIFPKNTSIYFVPDDNGCCASIVDHWQPIIEQKMLGLKDTFSGVSFQFVRNSTLIDHPFCQELLLKTIENPREQLELIKANSNKKTLQDPVQYAGAICPKCHRAHGKTLVFGGNRISWECDECHYKQEGDIKDFQYWWYHKPMFLARIEIFKIDVTLSGGDHFSEGDFNIRKAYIEKYSPNTKEPYMLFTPTVLAQDGQKMSKSRNNTASADIKKFIKAVDGFTGKEIVLTEDLIETDIYEKDYSYTV